MASTVMAYRFGRFEVRPAQRNLLVDGTAASLGARAFDVLVTLIERRDRVVSGDELFDLVWPGLVVEENNVRQQVAALRKALGAQAVVTVPGRGYRFALALDTDEAAVPATSATGQDERAVLNNLPLNSPVLIGRESELATVVELLSGAPLLTLAGVGGVGKTRFALEVADKVKGAYKNGVWFVELAPVADPALVPRVVAGVLDVHEEPGRPLLDTLLDFLRHRELLIILDNCEHLLGDCAAFADGLLRTADQLRLLATSRTTLGICGEHLFTVPPLSVPLCYGDDVRDGDPGHGPLPASEAVELLVDRASAVQPSFTVTEENRDAVVALCTRLDGLPLAIELAATRLRSLGVEQVVERLADRFRLLTGGSRVALPRQQTLRALIDWS